jgi:hypothetical protein
MAAVWALPKRLTIQKSANIMKVEELMEAMMGAPMPTTSRTT